jgi:hypothetical protein
MKNKFKKLTIIGVMFLLFTIGRLTSACSNSAVNNDGTKKIYVYFENSIIVNKSQSGLA